MELTQLWLQEPEQPSFEAWNCIEHSSVVHCQVCHSPRQPVALQEPRPGSHSPASATGTPVSSRSALSLPEANPFVSERRNASLVVANLPTLLFVLIECFLLIHLFSPLSSAETWNSVSCPLCYMHISVWSDSQAKVANSPKKIIIIGLVCASVIFSLMAHFMGKVQ